MATLKPLSVQCLASARHGWFTTFFFIEKKKQANIFARTEEVRANKEKSYANIRFDLMMMMFCFSSPYKSMKSVVACSHSNKNNRKKELPNTQYILAFGHHFRNFHGNNNFGNDRNDVYFITFMRAIPKKNNECIVFRVRFESTKKKINTINVYMRSNSKYEKKSIYYFFSFHFIFSI